MGNYNMMSNKFNSLMLAVAAAFLLISCISSIGIIILAEAGHEVLESPKELVSDVKHPDSFIDVRDGSYLVPGIGRFVLPRPGQDPLNYNPITGNSGGGLGGIGIGGDNSAGATHQYIPGGDDTFFNNPGFEIPIPGAGGAIP